MQIKLFIGTKATPEISYPAPLVKIPHEGKEYVGKYLANNQPTLNELRHSALTVVELLQSASPLIRCDTLPVVVFPELFCG